MSTTYRVIGMSCSGCANSLKAAINERSPETAVSVNLNRKEVTVAGPASEDDIKDAVADAGFTFEGVVA